MIARTRSDERGIAMVMAVLVTFVVLLLSTVVISQAIHNTGQAGYDRKRLAAINAAEAGIDWFFDNIEHAVTSPTSSLLQTAPKTMSLSDAPGTASFTATPTYYSNAAGTVPFSGSVTTSNFPKSVRIVSVGTASDGTTRKMETFAVLRAKQGGLTGALISNGSTTFSNNFTVNGYEGNDADVYVLTGDLEVPSGLETIKGSVYVTGGHAYVGTSLHIYGSVWANGYVSVDHPSALVDVDVKSTTSYVSVTKGTVLGDAYYCTGAAPGANVHGTKIQTCALGAPPSQPFPVLKYVPSAWEQQGYYLHADFTGATACTDARNYVEGTGSGTYNGGAGVPEGYTGVVVHIVGTCTYTSSNNATVTMGTDLAIVSDGGGFDLSQRSNWNGGPDRSGVSATRNLSFIAAWPSAGSPSCPAQNISVGNNTSFNNLVVVGVYGPCSVTMNNNNSSFNGQVIGQTLSIGNLFSMNYHPALFPGVNFSGYHQDVAYIRETR
jgi:Tfp pilus assembly protein PilX